MQNKYEIFHDLITYWQQYEEQVDKSSIKDFGRWLATRSWNTGNSDTSDDTDALPSKDLDTNEVPDAHLRQQFVSVLSKLSKCQDFYAKKFLDGLPINSLLEYHFLFSLNKSNVLKTIDIISMNMVEYTTGIDIIKRLNKLNLVTVFRDTLDKRNKKIKITSEGKKVLLEAMLRMNRMYEVYLGLLQKRNYGIALNILDKLNKFHTPLFVQSNNKSYFEIIQMTEQIINK